MIRSTLGSTVLIALLLAGCTIHRTAEVQTAGSVAAHLEEAGIEPMQSLRISRADLAAIQGSGRGMPWLQVFESSGALIFEEEGYTLGLAGRLENALRRSEPVSPPRSLNQEARKYETLDGEPATLELGAAEYVFVDHWATWCAPCRPHSKALQSFVADHPEKRIALVLVNWDEMAAPRPEGD